MIDRREFFDSNIVSSCQFDYIRQLFVIPRYNRNDVMVGEYNKYRAKKTLYPFQIRAGIFAAKGSV